MRLARVRDYGRWIAQQSEKWPFQLERLAFENIPTLGTGEVALSSPITLLAGPNGVGKSTLLRAIWATAASGLISIDGSTALKLTAGRVALDYRYKEQQGTRVGTFATGNVITQGEMNIDVVYIDAASAVQSHQADWCNFEDIEDIINGVGPRVIDQTALLEINYISRRDFREMKIYEIEATSGVVPFFEVAYGNDRYDSRTMGTGELASLYLWWAIDRSKDSSLFLIEEPETYLSPACQEALCHFIVASAYETKHSFIITSHSAKIISAIPTSGHHFLFRKGSGVNIIDGIPPPIILATIGITIPVDTILLVEDEAAAIFLRLILEKYNASVSRRAEIKICNGHGGITGILTKVAGELSNIAVFGVFDGDATDQISDNITKYSMLLPGNSPIEVAFRHMVEGDVDALRTATGSEDIPAILFGLQGADHHDWYSGLCHHLGLTKAQIFPLLFRLWIRKDGNVEDAQGLVAEVEKLIAAAFSVPA